MLYFEIEQHTCVYAENKIASFYLFIRFITRLSVKDHSR